MSAPPKILNWYPVFYNQIKEKRLLVKTVLTESLDAGSFFEPSMTMFMTRIK